MLNENSADQTASNEHEEELCEDVPLVDVKSNLIQIKAASEDEVSRRIQAFIRNKRNEIDERNIREFISPFSSEEGTSCARVEAVYVRREGEKSHVSLKRVENSYGPQTQIPADESDDRGHLSYRVPVDVQRAEAVEERLCNLEAHLNIKNDSRDIFARIKSLESKVSFLEGVSPEYFTNGITRKKRVHENVDQEESLSDINIKIRHLRQVLKDKAIVQLK